MLASAAAPADSLQGLLDAVETKNLAGVELVQGHGHGIEPGLEPECLEQVVATARDHDREIAGYRVVRVSELDPIEVAAFARALGAPVLLGSVADLKAALLERWIEAFDREEATLLLGLEDPAEIEIGRSSDLIDAHSDTVHFAWEATPITGTADQARWMLETLGSSLRYVRLPGMGPEALNDDDGRIGTLVTVMTLLGFRGPAVLTPSSDRELDLWRRWLGRRHGWGCGGGESTPEPTRLTSRGGIR